MITPSYNRAPFIKDAIESALRQDYHPFEHIIIDGGSTDGTLSILKEYRHLHVVSEPDQGMYDAINKGINLAKGEIIGLLNTDDLYDDGAFNEVAEAFESHPHIGAVVGGASVFTDDEGCRRTIRLISWIEPNELWKRLTIGAPVTNAWFFRSSVFDSMGTFNQAYKFSADREFLLRFASADIPWVPVKRVLYQYRRHLGSVTITPLDGRSLERALVRKVVLDESLRVSEDFLMKDDLPIEARRYLRRSHSVRSYRLAAMALYHRWWSLAWQTVWRGCRMNALWPLVFARMASTRLYKLIRERQDVD